MPTRILIADDNPLFRTALRHVLEASDSWEIIETHDGQEAVTTAVETRPDLIILDLAMPVKDGLAAAREISKLLPETPILMCTLHASPPVELEARKSGIRQLVSKSESVEIVAAIRQLIAKTPGWESSVVTALPNIALPASETITVLPPAQVQKGTSPADSITPGAIDPAPEKAAS
ncbi:MAG TPA: response regulator transcription factor [Candidatus Sulfotelmatobacter sp.]|nr:response regulator transcription factor [Candidatus Sulfotelmatobacter sp.]